MPAERASLRDRNRRIAAMYEERDPATGRRKHTMGHVAQWFGLNRETVRKIITRARRPQ